MRDLPPVKLDVAGVTYTFLCPKLTVWAEMAGPAFRTHAGLRDMALGSQILMFLHASLSGDESEALHQRKYDPGDPLDLPDLFTAFAQLVEEWRPAVKGLSRAAGVKIDLGDDAPAKPTKKPPAKRAPARPPRKR